MSFDASSDHKESNASAGIGASNSGDGGYGGPEDSGRIGANQFGPAAYGGPEDSGRPGANQFGLSPIASFSRTMTSQWNSFLDSISKPKNIGRALGLVVGGPIYGSLAAPLTGWAFDKVTKMDISMPSWSKPATDFTSSGNSMNLFSDTDGGDSRAYLDQQKARIQGIQQQVWMSYLQGQDPTKKPAISDDTYKGLLS